jgi:hypothetical protein
MFQGLLFVHCTLHVGECNTADIRYARKNHLGKVVEGQLCTMPLIPRPIAGEAVCEMEATRTN